MQVQSLGREDPLEKETATRSSILGCKIPWTEEPGGLQSMGWQSQTQLRHWAHTLCHYHSNQSPQCTTLQGALMALTWPCWASPTQVLVCRPGSIKAALVEVAGRSCLGSRLLGPQGPCPPFHHCVSCGTGGRNKGPSHLLQKREGSLGREPLCFSTLNHKQKGMEWREKREGKRREETERQ